MMDIDNNSNSYNTPRRSGDGGNTSLSNQKSARNAMLPARKQCFKVTYLQNERLTYDELDARGLLTRYNCFENQHGLDDEELEEMVGQVQTMFDDLK